MTAISLDDFRYFTLVVEHRGFTAAARRLGVPKSKLSRRIALLESRLGVRLIQRTTRGFAVTEIGKAYYRHCLGIVAEAEAAQAVIDQVRAEPRGMVRMACPVALLQAGVARVILSVLGDHPHVRVQMVATNRSVDVIEEGFDIALRARLLPLDDTGLIVRTLAKRPNALVASRAYLDRQGRPSAPADLSRHDTLDMIDPRREHRWQFTAPDGTDETVSLEPRLATDELLTLHRAVRAGLGIAVLPELLVRAEIERGDLDVLLPQWTLPTHVIHAVLPSRRGLLPAVRVILDRIAAEIPPAPSP